MEKTAKIKAEDIAFWILILLIISVAIWKMIGSPTDTAALIAVALFIAGSEILIWKAIFGIEKKNCINLERLDKKTAISFEKIKLQLNTMQKDIKLLLNKK